MVNTVTGRFDLLGLARRRGSSKALHILDYPCPLSREKSACELMASQVFPKQAAKEYKR